MLSQVSVLADGCRCLETSCPVLARNAGAIHRLEVVASLAAHRVDVVSAARYFVLAERLDMHFRVHRFGSPNGLP